MVVLGEMSCVHGVSVAEIMAYVMQPWPLSDALCQQFRSSCNAHTSIVKTQAILLLLSLLLSITKTPFPLN